MSIKLKWSFFVGVPALVALIYFGVLASDMYISKASFALRSPDQNNSLEWLAIFGQSSGGAGNDIYIIQEYLSAPSLFEELDRELDVKKHYQNKKADIFSRLEDSPSQEELSDYFSRQVSLDYDQVSKVASLKVRAFDPEFAQKLCETILEKSERLVNNLNNRAMEDSLSLSRTELKRAEERLAKIQGELRSFRQKHNLLDPRAEAGSTQGLIGELENSVAKAKTELAEARSYMKEDSSRVLGLKSRIRAIQDQAIKERFRLTGGNQSTLSSITAEYEQLALEQEFAQKQYMSAISSIETARIHAESQSSYLVAFLKPTLAEEPLIPRRGYAIGISFASILLAFNIGSLIVAAIREHAGV